MTRAGLVAVYSVLTRQTGPIAARTQRGKHASYQSCRALCRTSKSMSASDNKQKCPTYSYEVFLDLLGAMEAWVAQALPGDNMTNAVETVAAVVLAIFAVSTIRAAHLAPMAHRRNVLITVIVTAGGKTFLQRLPVKRCCVILKGHPGRNYTVVSLTHLSPIQPGLQWEHLPKMGSQWCPSLQTGHTSWQLSPKKPLEQCWSHRVPFQPRSQVTQRPSVTLQGCWPLQWPHLRSSE